jgi:hypothetical protein
MSAVLNSGSIPLSCNICPKKPSFSDVSHLLTHIASKGHLSHYYKLKIRAGADPNARIIVEEYDQWYAEWNVEDLMSERMSLKDKKRPRLKQSGKSEAAQHSSSIRLLNIIISCSDSHGQLRQFCSIRTLLSFNDCD